MLTWDKENISERWGEAITDERDIRRIKKKYFPNGQMPSNLDNIPIMVSSLNDWFPIHLMNVVPFSMLFDYSLANELSGKRVVEDARDNVTKFDEGYQQVINHLTHNHKLD